MPSKYGRRNMSLSCPSCESTNSNNHNSDQNTTIKFPDNQNHILHQSVAFSHLGENLSTNNDMELIQFFKQIVETRINKGVDWHNDQNIVNNGWYIDQWQQKHTQKIQFTDVLGFKTLYLLWYPWLHKSYLLYDIEHYMQIIRDKSVHYTRTCWKYSYD